MIGEPEERADKPTRLLRWALMALFWGALIFALAMALISPPPPLPGAPSDKFLHMLVFATLTALWALAYPNTSLIVILLTLTALGGSIELVQGTALINREASLADWCADTLAIVAVLTGFALQRAARSLLRW